MSKDPFHSSGAKMILSAVLVAAALLAAPFLIKEVGESAKNLQDVEISKTNVEAKAESPPSTTQEGVENEGASLASYMPPECAPAGTFPQEKTVGLYRLTTLQCADANWFFEATFVQRAKDASDIVFFQISNQFLMWHRKGGQRMELRPMGNPPFESFEGFGSEQPVKVVDFMLNGEKLDLLKTPIHFQDGGLGGLQGALFQVNSNYTGGTLKVGGRSFMVDFVEGAVTAK
jgi:hypothetical protein